MLPLAQPDTSTIPEYTNQEHLSLKTKDGRRHANSNLNRRVYALMMSICICFNNTKTYNNSLTSGNNAYLK